MKAMHKQLWGYLLITLSLAGFTPLQAQTDSADEGGYITVSGIVKDKKSKKSLEYVNISIPGSTTGTVTNADGEFSFKVKDSIHAKEVEISHLGYFNSKIELNGKDVEEQLALAIHRVNALFFKNDRDAQLFQLTHHGHTVKHISGETGDGLGIDDVDFAIHAILNHLSEFRPTLRTASAAFIRIDLYEFLIGVIGEQLCEVAFLNLIGTFLTLHAGADSAIGRRPFLFHYNFHCVILLGVVV